MAEGDSSKGTYVCTLSPELIKKAEDELNEKPEWRARDIQALREMVLKNPGLKCPTDDMFLLKFLRARKFDYDRAYNLIVNYYTIRAENPGIFKDLKPSAVKHLLEDGVVGVLPKPNKDGQRIVFFRPGRWDPDKYPIYDMLRTNVITFEKLIQDEATQINGIVFIAEMGDLGLKHARHMERNYARLTTSVLQEAFPMRFKGIHFYHEPSIFGYIFAIMRPFMKEKLTKRLNFHGWDESSLHKVFDPSLLPEECGGTLGPVNTKTWMDTLLACEDEYEEMMKYSIFIANDAVKSHKEDAMECLSGTYKKLSVD